MALSFIEDNALKTKIRRLIRAIPTVPGNVDLSLYESHDLVWMQNELKHFDNDDDRWYMYGMMKMAVVFEDIYYGIFASDEKYSEMNSVIIILKNVIVSVSLNKQLEVQVILTQRKQN